MQAMSYTPIACTSGYLGVAGSPLGNPRGIHPHPIKPVFYGNPTHPRGGEPPRKRMAAYFRGELPA